jgi:hypothetical protein
VVESGAQETAGNEPLPPLPFETALPEGVRAGIEQPFTGDLEEMVTRRLVRVGVAYNRTLYFVDQGAQRGIAYECDKLMADELNKRCKTGNLKVNFWFMPLPRDLLLPALVDGKVERSWSPVQADRRSPRSRTLPGRKCSAGNPAAITKACSRRRSSTTTWQDSASRSTPT